MAENKQEALKQTYDMLSILRNNTNQEMVPYLVPDTYVGEFHSVLKRLEVMTGVDISEFRVPDSIRRPRLLDTITGEQKYSEEKYVEKPDFLTKIDAVLNYLKP